MKSSILSGEYGPGGGGVTAGSVPVLRPARPSMCVVQTWPGSAGFGALMSRSVVPFPIAHFAEPEEATTMAAIATPIKAEILSFMVNPPAENA